ncbi:(2Fe-2S)-binding protein [Eoetvoesiella caeni]
MKLHCWVNEVPVETEVEPRLLLSDFLRHELNLTGTHVGCEMGACGACTVVIDGSAVRSCLMLAAQADGCRVQTVEGVAKSEVGPLLHESFSQNHGLQCGYCTPGILTTLASVMRKGQLPQTEAEVRDLLSGNICRCTGYQGIVDAVLAVAQNTRAARSAS